MRLLVAVAITSGLFALASAQDKQTERPPDKPTAAYTVELSRGDPASKGAPRYSPPGRPLKLEAKAHAELPGLDHLDARLKVGPNTAGPGHLLVLARSQAGKPHDRLYVDADGTGKVAAKAIDGTPSVNRGKTWSSFNATVRVDHGRPGAPAKAEDFPVALWVVVEKEGDTPDIVRVSRRGFLAGPVILGETKAEVVLSDSGTDGVFGPGDWWELRTGPAAGEMRTVGDFAWAGGRAWKLEPVGSDGRKGRVVAFDPGLTEAEDKVKRDRLREDRLAKRADKPVAFRKDVDAALKEAVQAKGAYFLKFETDWCGPCKEMTALVFTAKDVADAAAGLTCVVVDGDARKDLTEKYKVTAYPTGVLVGADGQEAARYVGYQSVKMTTEFLRKVKK
jgi:thiol-disulfide isomerase/thioredoxin